MRIPCESWIDYLLLFSLLTEDESIFAGQNNSKFQEFLQHQQSAITKQIEESNNVKRKRAITIQKQVPTQSGSSHSSQAPSPPSPPLLKPPQKRQRVSEETQGGPVSPYLHEYTITHLAHVAIRQSVHQESREAINGEQPPSDTGTDGRIWSHSAIINPSFSVNDSITNSVCGDTDSKGHNDDDTNEVNLDEEAEEDEEEYVVDSIVDVGENKHVSFVALCG